MQLNPGVVAATVGEEHQLADGTADLHLDVATDDAASTTVARVEHDANPGAPQREACETAEYLPQTVHQTRRQIARFPAGLGSPKVLMMDEELVGVHETIEGIEPQG